MTESYFVSCTARAEMSVRVSVSAVVVLVMWMYTGS